MDELLNSGKNTDNVLTLSMGLDRKSYSPLNQINKNNVKRLVPVWSTSLNERHGRAGGAVVHNGVIYAINGKWTFAIDVDTASRSGARRCSSSPAPRAPTPRSNRGAPTIYNGKLFRVTNDNYLVALDMRPVVYCGRRNSRTRRKLLRNQSRSLPTAC